MLKTILVPLVLPLFLLFSNGFDNSVARRKQINNTSDKSVARSKQNIPDNQESQTGTLEKMTLADGSAEMEIDLNRLNGIDSAAQMNSLRFAVAPSSVFTILVFNKVLRGPETGSMALIPKSSAVLPYALDASFNQLVIEKAGWTKPFDLIVRDSKTGFTFFNIEGNLYDYDAKAQVLNIQDGRLLVSEEFAAKLGRMAEAGSVVGTISITARMRPIEVTQVVNGEALSAVLPAPLGSLVPGPDVIVGVLPAVQQFGSSGTQVGLAVATDSCNAGAEPLHWFALPNNDHPVIPQNLYRMSGGATNDERFEQIGQSWLKHAFTALQQDACGLGCQSSGTGTLLGAGCSDPYSASLNATQSGLGSRAWVNPFTGAYPTGSGAGGPRDHTGHSHSGTSHRVVVETSDLNPTLNPGATYYAEAQYVTPHEYAWCQANPGQCNMYNNASYRRFNVTGTTSFSFSPVGSTVQTKPAIVAWTGATSNPLEPAPGVDGVAFVSYKVTNPSPGVWHYEYVVYNQNLDRAIQSFSVPLGPGVTISNLGFHAPPQPAASANDGTAGSAGYSSTPWTPTQTPDSLTWNSETFAQNPNANAIRWGTLYNFRFDSNSPPQTTNATIGFFKTGTPTSIQIQGPSGGGPTPTPTPGYAVTASPSTVSPGQTITVAWTAPSGQSATDWIGLYRVGDPDTSFISYQYTAGAASGSRQFFAPQAGQYEFRYFTNDTFIRVATSNTVTVSGSAAFSLTASPSTVSPGQTINVAWTAPAGEPATDWIGLYRVGDPDLSFISYQYTAGAASGSRPFTAPQAGQYEFRYFTNDSFTRVATSNTVTVSGSATFSLTASPSTVSPGQTITVAWTAPSGQSATDWIGLYRVGDPDTSFISYQYTAGAASGSRQFFAPQAGQYEFRYFTNDTFIRVATSNTVTVSGSAAFSLTASPSTVSPGQTINVAWTAPAGEPATDWIGLYRVGDPDLSFISYQYTAGAASGSRPFTAPQAGQYEFRYFTNDSFTRVATSNTVTVGAGFNAVPVAAGISNPTAMAFAPDGRLFVCQQTGQLRVIENGALLATPFVTITVDSNGERGMLGVAFDPNFATNQFVYVYYTATTPAIHNRVSRFTANGNVALAGSEVPILDLDNLSATNHNGGAIHFGPDGLLYVAVGEDANAANSQSVGNLLGKILRINSDGTLPINNPLTFPGIAGPPSGINRAIWSVGLRNPYTFDFQPGSGRMFINDVGETTWEEINDGIAGSNYGWSICEGPCAPPNANYRDPLFQYGHGGGSATGCAITGGAFYNPAVVTYPSDYVGKYFYAEFCSGWIRRFDPATSTSQPFASGLSSPVDLKVGPDGNLYYLVRGGGGAVFKIVYS